MIEFVAHGGFILGQTAMEQGQPWLRPDSARYIEQNLPEKAFVFEWGMGASTIWLARRGYRVISMELDHDWFLKINDMLDREELAASTFCHTNFEEYADYINRYENEQFDFVLVDGRNRCRCLANARSKVKVGGLLCLDNSEREEYAKAVALLDGWKGYSWGDDGWSTAVWIRPPGDISPIIFESEDA